MAQSADQPLALGRSFSFNFLARRGFGYENYCYYGRHAQTQTAKMTAHARRSNVRTHRLRPWCREDTPNRQTQLCSKTNRRPHYYYTGHTNIV